MKSTLGVLALSLIIILSGLYAEEASALENSTGSSVEELVETLKNPAIDGQVRMDAAYALGLSGDRRAVLPLIEALKTDMEQRTGIWAACIPALGELGDPQALDILLKALKKRDDFWLGREMAARALGQIGDKRALGALENAAWMADTRSAAIEALSHFAEPSSAEIFLSALGPEEEEETVISALKGLHTLDRQAVEPLIGYLKDYSTEHQNISARCRAIGLLGLIGGPKAQAALSLAKEDKNDTIRECAIQALSNIPKKQ